MWLLKVYSCRQGLNLNIPLLISSQEEVFSPQYHLQDERIIWPPSAFWCLIKMCAQTTPPPIIQKQLCDYCFYLYGITTKYMYTWKYNYNFWWIWLRIFWSNFEKRISVFHLWIRISFCVNKLWLWRVRTQSLFQCKLKCFLRDFQALSPNP